MKEKSSSNSKCCKDEGCSRLDFENTESTVAEILYAIVIKAFENSISSTEENEEEKI